ncbi:hypothetical protein HY486_01565 [Candidatus Woesearchaeota archaeon]|nr:hypothetical protein [Candidatus Woesearchaeota archaeon]
MDARKLVKAGKHSNSISLPKAWLTKHGLKTGDSVYLIEGQHDLTVTPLPTAPTIAIKEKTIEIGNKQIETVRRELTSAYINNYGIIHFTQVKNPEQITTIIKDFAGLEVVEQSEAHVSAKDLLNLAEINIDQSVRRMDMIIRTLFKEEEEREGDLNRTYFLLYRLLKGAISDQKMADALSLKKENTISIWSIITNLEDIGDVLKTIKKKEMLAEIEKHYLNAMKAYFTKDKLLAEQVLSKWHEAIEKNKSEQIRDIATRINNIARIVLDMD